MPVISNALTSNYIFNKQVFLNQEFFAPPSKRITLTMQKPILLLIISLALFSGCDRKEKRSSSSAQTPATTSTPKAAEAQPSPPIQPAQPSELKSQPVAVTATDSEKLAVGEKVYKGTCSICHKTGLNSAPRMGSRKDWELRLAQEKKLLYSRAINGYRGSKGSMPSRGSNPRLSDVEIKAAVDYMVEHAIPAWSVD